MIRTTKKEQLGMDPATASNRLIKDILFDLIKNKVCYRCGELMSRDTFSIDHKVPWLHSSDPTKLFFEIDNIDFSHLSCNIKNARVNKIYNSDLERKSAKNKKNREKYNSIPKEERKINRKIRYEKYKY